MGKVATFMAMFTLFVVAASAAVLDNADSMSKEGIGL
jgi:hypothetical protein